MRLDRWPPRAQHEFLSSRSLLVIPCQFKILAFHPVLLFGLCQSQVGYSWEDGRLFADKADKELKAQLIGLAVRSTLYVIRKHSSDLVTRSMSQ